ncbi:MAG: carboxypeptidase-like regulatory domain-containing protein [Pseudomonadota bacterium]
MYLPRAFFTIFFGGIMAMTLPACASDTGVRGTVLMGPITPGPTRPNATDEAPVGATLMIYGKDQKKVVKIVSDKDGKFELSLPPGDYVIVPAKDTPVPFPHTQTTQVVVPTDGYAEVTIRLDTGMR